MRDDFERVLCGPEARGFYESNYLKANDPRRGGAFWLKYNLLAPADGRRPRFGELWAVVWREPGQRPVVVKSNVPGSSVRTDPGAIAIDLGDASLRADRVRGAIESERHRVSWDLELLEGDTPMWLYPFPFLYNIGFPKKKVMVSRPRHVFRGTLEVDDVQVAVEDWVGIRSHNWGPEHNHSYAYGTINLWDQPGYRILNAATSRLQLGPVLSPWLSVAVMRLPKAEIRFGDPSRWVNKTSRVDFPTWSCTFEHGGSRLRTRWSADPEDVAGLRYLHPDGRVSYCYNTSFAEVEVHLEHRGGSERLTTDLAELEFLFPNPVPGIPLHGNDLIPDL